MKILFGAENSFLYLLVCIVLATGITLIIYFKNKEVRELGKWQVRVLYTLRFLSVLLLSVLLLSPIIKTLKKYTNNPVIITAYDNSTSMLAAGDQEGNRKEFNAVYDQLQDAFKGDFDLVNYTFGEEAATNRPLDFSEKKSNYSNVINTVYNNHFNDNIGALIIVGDGIYNIGSNPVSEVQKLNFPVYTLGMGDTSVVKDAAITEIRVNRNVFVGNKFPVELSLKFEKMANEPVTAQVLKDGQIIFSQRVVPATDDFFTTIGLNIQADLPGLLHYSVQLNTMAQERNKKNNTSGFVINVIQNKQKILILSEGPHPDLGAIKNTLELQQNYDISIFTQEPYPDNFNDFNLIILNQIPSVSTAGRSLINKTLESKIPLFIIVGNKTFLPQLNQLNLGIEIIPQAGTGEEAQPVVNPDFKIFKVSDELFEMVEKFPPLRVPFAEINLDASFSTLLYQKLNNIKTQRPLISMGYREGRKIGVIFGEGIWHWRLYNYYFNESNNQFNEFVNSIVQYLSLRENDDNFIVNYQQVFYETDPIILNAEVYDEAFELINDPEVSVDVTDDSGNTFQFIFDKDGQYYRLNAGKLPVGNYNFTAHVTIGKEEFTETGNFAIVPLNIENVVSKANHNVLFQLSNLTGGQFFQHDQLTDLISAIKKNQNIKPTSYIQSALNEILNLKWLFFVLILVFSMEWFLRKYWGIY